MVRIPEGQDPMHTQMPKNSGSHNIIHRCVINIDTDFASTSRIHPPALPFPNSGLKGRIISGDKLRTISWTSIFCSIDSIGSSPSPAKVNVGNDALIPKVTAYVAVCRREVCQSFAPSARVGSSSIRYIVWDVGRNLVAREEPHSDTLITPLHGIDTTAVVVKRFAIGLLTSHDPTASVVVGGVLAIFVESVTSLFTLDIHFAA